MVILPPDLTCGLAPFPEIDVAIIKGARAIDIAADRGSAIIGSVVSDGARIVGAQSRAVRQMPYALIIAVPNTGFVFLTGRYRRTSR